MAPGLTTIMSDASPPPRYDPTWTPPRGTLRNHTTTSSSASGATSGGTTSAANANAHFHHRVPLLSTTDDDDELLGGNEDEQLNAGDEPLEASASQGLLSYHSALGSLPHTPPSPVPLILLTNGDQHHFRCDVDHNDQSETRPVSPATPPPPGAPPRGLRGSSLTAPGSDFSPCPLRAVSTSPSLFSVSSNNSQSTDDGAEDEESQDSLSSPPSYPDSPPSYPDSPPSYPHSPPEYPAAAAAAAAAAAVVVPGYSDASGTYLHCIFPPREVPCLFMASPIPPPSSSSSYGITVEPAGSHTSLSQQPLGSGNSLTHPINNNNGAGGSSGAGGGGEGSRSSLNHPVVVRTGSRNSLTGHQPLGSKHSLNHPGMSRKSMTRHSFHHPPQPQGRMTASQLMRTASTHAPRTSPLHRDRSSTNNSTRSKGSGHSNSQRSLSPSIPFYPHNLPGTRSASWNDLDPTSATSADSAPVTLILQDINPDSTAIYLTHVNHPTTCQLIDPTDLEQILLAEGQRDIDQFENADSPKKRTLKLRNVCLVFWSLACHLGFFTCIGLLAWQVTLKRQSELQYQIWSNHPIPDRRGPKPASLHSDKLLIVASVLLVVCYVFSWVESCVSDTHRYIDHKMELTKCRMYVRRMRVTVPKLRWSIDCYHWSSEDPAIRNSGEKPQHEKVMTHTEVEEFPFSVCKDASGDLGTFKKSAINRFEFEKTFGFVDRSTADVYEQRKQAFMQRNMYMDKHYTFKEVFELDGMESHMTVYVERGHLTKLMSFQLYSCLACCLLTWPYRILFRCFTKKRKFTFVKLLGL